MHTGQIFMNDLFHLFCTICILSTELLHTGSKVSGCQVQFPDLPTTAGLGNKSWTEPLTIIHTTRAFYASDLSEEVTLSLNDAVSSGTRYHSAVYPHPVCTVNVEMIENHGLITVARSCVTFALTYNKNPPTSVFARDHRLPQSNPPTCKLLWAYVSTLEDSLRSVRLIRHGSPTFYHRTKSGCIVQHNEDHRFLRQSDGSMVLQGCLGNHDDHCLQSIHLMHNYPNIPLTRRRWHRIPLTSNFSKDEYG